ncbi:MAG: O-antigen ligase family protein [Candidatus Omnitrophota bacterium]
MIILGGLLLLSGRRPHVPVTMGPYGMAIGLLLLSYALSTIFSINIHNSLKEVLRFISCVSVFFIVSRLKGPKKDILVKTMVIAAAIISIYSIYQYFWGYQHTLDFLKRTNSDFLSNSPYARDILMQKRAIGTFPSPNIFAGYLITLFFLACYAGRISNPGSTLFQLAVIVIAVMLTKSLGAYLSLIISLAVMLFLFRGDIKKRRSIIIFCLIAACAGIAFILSSKWGRLMNLDNPHNPAIQRLNYWRITIAAIKDHPLIGIGPGNFQEVFLKYKSGWSIDSRYSHNILLQTWLETGVVSLAAICLLIITFTKRSLARSKYLFLAGLAFILHNLLDLTYFIPETGLFWWVLLGLTADDE